MLHSAIRLPPPDRTEHLSLDCAARTLQQERTVHARSRSPLNNQFEQFTNQSGANFDAPFVRNPSDRALKQRGNMKS